MKKLTLITSLLILTILLGACSSVSATPDGASEATEQPAESVDFGSLDAEGPPSPPTCVPNPPPPTPSEDELAVFSVDPETDWIKGPEDAVVTIIEYADFQCPYCSIASRNLKALLEKYPDDVRVVYRHFPLASIHDKAIPATQAVEAAGLQDPEIFWVMHDLLYETQGAWSGYSIEEFESWVIDLAAELGLDPVQFQADYNSEEIVSFAEGTWIEGQALGIPGTPYLKSIACTKRRQTRRCSPGLWNGSSWRKFSFQNARRWQLILRGSILPRSLWKMANL